MVVAVHVHLLLPSVGSSHGGGCGWWLLFAVLVVVVLRKEAMSHIMTRASHLSSHVTPHMSIVLRIFTCPMEFCWLFHGFVKCSRNPVGLNTD